MKKTILFTCLTALLAACSGKSAVTAPEETTVQPCQPDIGYGSGTGL